MSPALLDPADLAQIQAITAKDRSNLYLTSQFLGDPLRYQAFLAMYAVMRVIDDAVDDVEDKHALDAAARAALHTMLDAWQARIDAAYAGAPGDQALDRGLAWALARFPIPAAHWQRFVAAMHYDVDNPRFPDFASFLDYAQGATVAPTTISAPPIGHSYGPRTSRRQLAFRDRPRTARAAAPTSAGSWRLGDCAADGCERRDRSRGS